MLSLIKTEFENIYLSKLIKGGLIALTLSVLLGALVISIVIPPYSDWQENLENEIEHGYEKLEDPERAQDSRYFPDDEYIDPFIEYYQYHLDQNIRFPSPKILLTDMSLTYLVILICCSVIAVRIISREHNVPQPSLNYRIKMFVSKYMVMNIFVVILLGLELGFSILIGGVLIGFEGMFDPLVGYDLAEIPLIPHLLKAKLILVLVISVYLAWSMLIASIIKSRPWAIGIAIGSTAIGWFVSFIETDIIYGKVLPLWSKWFFFSYTQIAVYRFDTVSGSLIQFASLVLIVSLVVFLGASFFILNKKYSAPLHDGEIS
ncbi:hypothetical protein [Risungbinella massiliensis]|uniref:hypothetical protein n=1 Tax=Risungbinella massiliensis TaxID=1329796 RepID=UPI0005CBBB52|nr:hypothetical protein [Risungbinella massiliensis]